MIKKFLVVLIVFATTISHAQEATSSPYSFFGIGSLNFKGTVENRTMGGISMFSDSIHLNLQNPSGFAALNMVAFTVGGAHKTINQKTSEESNRVTTTSLNYMAIGFPMGKFGGGFGIMPLTAVGYKLRNQTGDVRTEDFGNGGLNKVFLALGYQVIPELSVGVDANYNFGNIFNQSLRVRDNIEFGTRETNRSDLSGFSVNFGATYKKTLENKLQITSALTYTPETNLNSRNQREFATVFSPVGGLAQDVDVRNEPVDDTEMTFPSKITFGAGIGKARNWFVGAEYTNEKTSNFTNRSFTLENVEFKNASKFSIGGFYLPKYNPMESYLERVSYRAGVRLEETGLVVNGEDINEFGISFGVGLPVGKLFSNINLGFEIGKRGTTSSGLVQENFFNTFISLSLNDRWFIKTYYD